jgi:hypothetical protein
MSNNTNVRLKYRTLDQLLAEVRTDLYSYDMNGEIRPEGLIKVIKTVNAELGIKIHKTKNAVIEIENGWAKLPDDFHMLNFAYLLGNFEEIVVPPQGTHVEEVPLAPIYNPGPDHIDICATPPACPEPVVPECNTCANPQPCNCAQTCNSWVNCKGEEMMLIQKIKYTYRKYTEFYRIKIVGPPKFMDPSCPNKNWIAQNQGYLADDNYIRLGIKSGTLYINYEGMMEDEQGNLLVLDHDLINNYYEYACKDRFFENRTLNNEPVPPNAMQLVMARLRESRLKALGIVRMPEYTEIRKAWEMNRKARFVKYYSMFK